MKQISDISSRIKEYRDMNNLTLADMERLTNIPAQTLNRYELRQRIPKIDVANQIAESLKVNPLWLQGYDEPMVEPDPLKTTLKDAAITALLSNIANLTPENREKLADYLTLLLQTQK